MTAFVVDTNVPIAANDFDTHASPECVEKCAQALLEVQNGQVVMDADGRIFQEYARYLSRASRQLPGTAFYLWVLNNQYTASHCELVSLTLRNQNQNDGAQSPDPNDFVEFPNDPELAAFDPSDRKFIAVAHASKNSPTVLEATDTKWGNFREAFERNGISVRFLCLDEMPE